MKVLQTISPAESSAANMESSHPSVEGNNSPVESESVDQNVNSATRTEAVRSGGKKDTVILCVAVVAPNVSCGHV